MALSTVVNAALPALSGSKVTYNQEHDIFLSQGYTSAAGNTYFQGIRLSDRLIVNFDFGQGWYYLFLNGIRIYGYDGNEKKLIASRSFYNYPFSEGRAKQECTSMLLDFMKAQVKMLKQSVPVQQLEEFSRAMIDAVGCANKKLLY